MRTKTSSIIVMLALVGCAGGDGLGSSATQSPFYNPMGEAGGGDDDGDVDDTDETGTDGGDDDGAGPIPEDPDPSSADADSGAPSDDDGGSGTEPPPQPPVGGDCCTPAGTPGCANDPNVEMCVCQIDDFCCAQQWDDTCVAIVGECAEPCPGAELPTDSSGGTDGGGSDGGMGDGDCCAPTGVPGCADQEIASCVCQIDDFCCVVEWDDVCAEIATECGC